MRRNRSWRRSGRRRGCGMVVQVATSKTRCSTCDARHVSPIFFSSTSFSFSRSPRLFGRGWIPFLQAFCRLATLASKQRGRPKHQKLYSTIITHVRPSYCNQNVYMNLYLTSVTTVCELGHLQTNLTSDSKRRSKMDAWCNGSTSDSDFPVPLGGHSFECCCTHSFCPLVISL
jgi:hypothetical protein